MNAGNKIEIALITYKTKSGMTEIDSSIFAINLIINRLTFSTKRLKIDKHDITLCPRRFTLEPKIQTG